MHKNKESKNLKKIISITKTESLNRESKSPKINNNKIKNISNIKLYDDKNFNEDNNLERKIKISLEKENEIDNKNSKSKENNYFV